MKKDGLRDCVRKKCIDCTYDKDAPGTTLSQVETCMVFDCPLWPVRGAGRRSESDWSDPLREVIKRHGRFVKRARPWLPDVTDECINRWRSDPWNINMVPKGLNPKVHSG